MENNRKMVPKRRFKEFQNAGDWEQRKVKEFANESSLKGHTGIEAKKLTVKLHTRGVEKADVKIQGSDNTQYYIRRAGQLIYGKQNFFNGAIGIVPVMLDKYESTKDVPAFDIDKAVDVYWIYLYLARPEIYEPQELNCTGTGSKRFHVSDFLNMPVTIPRLEEQQKISKYLKTYEYLITLHQRKLDKIKAIKKAYLSEMFPQNGEKKPRRRFKGFTDDWEQRKLGEIGYTYTGLSGKTKEDFGHGNAKFITYMNVFSNSINDPTMVEPIEIDAKQNEVEVGDVFFTTSSETPEEVGMSSVLLEKHGKTYLNSFCFGYRPMIKVNSYFLAYMLRSKHIREKIILLAQGISRYNISKTRVMEIAVPIPSLSEQKCIGQYLYDLDNIITLHQRKLEKLKNIKKAYLNEMFV